MKPLPSLLFAISFTINSGFAAELRITSITREGECTTLTWVSQPREFYTVFSTESLVPPISWQVAAVNVPCGGDTTTWSEGCESQNSMMNSLSLAAQSQPLVLNGEELALRMAASLSASSNAVTFLMAKLQEATERATAAKFTEGMFEVAQFSTENIDWPFDPPEGGGFGANYPTTAKFYRIARTPVRWAVPGFVDGWGPTSTNVPPGPSNFVAVAAGLFDSGTHNLALRSDGTVVAWGANFWGQTNVPSGLSDVIAIAVGGRHSAALKRDGALELWGDNSFGQRTNAPPGLTNVVDVKAGLWHTMALRADGTVAAWGDLFNRSNSVPPGLSNVVEISAGPRHCLARKADGTVVAWGFTYTNILGNYLPTNTPTNLLHVVEISAGMEHNQALLSNSTVVVWGASNNPASLEFPFLTNCTGVRAGWHYGLALNSDSSAAGWGNSMGDVGMDAIVAASAGARHVLVVRTNNESPVILKQPTNIVSVAGLSHAMSVTATSGAPSIRYQWQRDGTNILGATNTILSFTNLQLADEGNYRALVATDRRTNATRYATVTVILPPVIVGQSPASNIVFAQRAHSVDTTINASYKGVRWLFDPQRPDLIVGYDTNVQLTVSVESHGWPRPSIQWFKDGNAMASYYPEGVPEFPLVGSASEEGTYFAIVSNPAGSATSGVWHVQIRRWGAATGWGDDTFDQLTAPAAETNLVAIAAGAFHTLGLRENSTVAQWGDTNGAAVPAGLTNVTAISGGYYHSLALRENGSVVAWGDPAGSANFVPTNLAAAKAIAAGWNHNLALHSNGTVSAWGVNGSNLNWNLLQIPPGITNASSVAAGTLHSLVLRSNGTVVAWGYNADGQTNVPSGLSNVVAVAGGGMHSLALCADGTVTAWGANGYGQCDVPSGLSNVQFIAAGFEHSVALRNDGTVVCWGQNTDGQATLPAELPNTWRVAAGGYHTVAVAYDPVLNYPVDVPRDVMLIYNEDSTNSVIIKEYYRTNRPGVSQAMQFPIHGNTNETYASTNDLGTNLIATLLDWYAQNPTLRPRYVICFFGVPTRVWHYENPEPITATAVGVELQRALGVRPPFVNYIAMGADEAIPGELTNGPLPDCFAYIDKIARFGSNYSPGKLFISASAIGYQNTTYVLDDENRFYGYPPNPPATHSGASMDGIVTALQSLGVPANRIDYVPQTFDLGRVATNVAGYQSWGYYGWQCCYARNHAVEFLGDSTWFIMATVESYNGQRTAIGSHGRYTEWFYRYAFGGGNTPVGAVCHVEEPGVFGNHAITYFGLWEGGKLFATCAAVSRNSPTVMVVGDPFVKR